MPVKAAPFAWSKLNKLQVGRYAEYLVKMEFTLYGLDVYGAEVDDKGIDFVVRVEPARYYDVQVKSIRGYQYVFFPKHCFELRDNMLAAVVLFHEGKAAQLYLIRASQWKGSTKGLFTQHDYVGKKSKPEFGLNISHRNLPELESFAFDKIVAGL